MASVAGLAPARFCLKGRMLELLCIHGPLKLRIQNANGELHICILNPSLGMVPEVGIAPTSPRLQQGANLPQLLGDWLAEPKLGE
jgi:hypothetical protein